MMMAAGVEKRKPMIPARVATGTVALVVAAASYWNRFGFTTKYLFGEVGFWKSDGNPPWSLHYCVCIV